MLSRACDDAVDTVYGSPPTLDVPLGTVLRCARDRRLTKDDLDAFQKNVGITADPALGGATVYRILYRTERAGGVAGYASGVLVVPDTMRGASSPIVSASHGAWGQSPRCIQSKQAIDNVRDPFASMVLGAAAAGFPVVASDYAGFNDYGAKGNPPSGMAFSEDVAKSTLDALRAARSLLGSLVSNGAFFGGHSQGGHTALSALAFREGYAPEIEALGVVAYSPLWFSQASWGAMFFLGASFPVAENPFPTAVGIWYHYSHAAILDGMDHALDIFAPEKRQAVKTFFDEDCLDSHYDLLKSSATIPADLYDPEFVDAVVGSAATGQPCSFAEPKKQALCERWIERYAADRPHLTGSAAKVPILIAYGGQDSTIPADRAICGIDRLTRDGANLTVCYDRAGGHGSIVPRTEGLAARWMAHVAFGDPAPSTACDGGKEAFVMPDGSAAACAANPPND